ncbi:MAG: putative addiction module antidote protein [Deltaproteobacteria bacterium]|nr:putative addiction module antidote protein [Deltaproteobacteria bacterium]
MQTAKKPKSTGQTTKVKRLAKPTKSYQATLLDALKDPEEAVAYLNAALEEESEGAEELFLLALRNVAEARGIAKLAGDAALNRESLYRVLSLKGNPRLSTLGALLDALGLRLAVEVKAA